MDEPTSAPGRISRLNDYYPRYRRLARQLATRRLALQWMDAGVPPAEAAAWANLGYMPDEAAGHIAAGHTPAEIAAIEAAEDAADGDETSAALHEYAAIQAAEAAAVGGHDLLIDLRIKALADAGIIDLGRDPTV
jgi:hypothetical protein